MECGHSSIREWTKMRGKGHVPALPEVSAKAICRFISKHHSHHCETAEDPEQQEPEANPGKSKGGGGAWRAFCSDRFSGIKFSRENLRAASREFKALTPEEHAHYKEVGHLMTLQAKHERMKAVNVHPGSRELALPDGSIKILEDPDSTLMIAGDDFSERFGSFKQIILQEQRAKRQAEQIAQDPVDPTDSAAQDPSLVELVNSGGPGLLEGLRRNPNCGLAVDRFRWKLPIIPFIRAALDFAARSEDEPKVADLENAWARLHELVQHEKQQKLDFGNGKPFPVTPCRRLGTCVCSPVGKAAAVMFQRLMAYMKSTHPGTAKEPSPARLRFSSKLCVLELCSESLGLDPPPTLGIKGPGHGPTLLYLHCGHTNYSTWETTCTRLHVCFYNPNSGHLVVFVKSVKDVKTANSFELPISPVSSKTLRGSKTL